MHETEVEKQVRLQEQRKTALKHAFEVREDLVRQLADYDALIAREGRLYWKHLGFTVMPRVEKLRIAIMGE